METQLDFFQTLADPTRRLIVEALRSGERQVNDIVEGAGIHQSGVSRHLRILHEAGFVSMRPEGQRRLYSLRAEPFREHDKWLAQYRSLWESALTASESRLMNGGESESLPRKVNAMTDTIDTTSAKSTGPKTVIERLYRARVEELWELWTTKEGFESWWGPEGFRRKSRPSRRDPAVRCTTT